MNWKTYLGKTTSELAEYLKSDIQYREYSSKKLHKIARREIEIFLEEKRGWDLIQLILKENSLIAQKDKKLLGNFINRRKKSIPLAYIVGRQEFYSSSFKINKNTLIPRPETEELVEHVLRYIRRNTACYLPVRQEGVPTKYKTILIDLGTGSGCILTAILKNLPKNTKFSEIYAVDKSNQALKIAKENIKKHLGKSYKIKFIEGSLLEFAAGRDATYCISNTKYIIVANLPYLSEKEYQNLSPEVKKYEPKNALIGGKEGHELICELIDQAVVIKNEFDIFLEISPIIYPKIKEHLVLIKIPFKLKTKKDISGKIRFLHLSFTGQARI